MSWWRRIVGRIARRSCTCELWCHVAAHQTARAIRAEAEALRLRQILDPAEPSPLTPGPRFVQSPPRGIQ